MLSLKWNRCSTNDPLTIATFGACIAFIVGNTACSSQDNLLVYREIPLEETSEALPSATEDSAKLLKEMVRPFGALPQRISTSDNSLSEARVTLGKTLFEDKRFSSSGEVSCATCHVLASYGVDGRATALGDEGRKGKRNTPTVWNAAGHVGQHWDGRVLTVEEQAKLPFFLETAMAMPDIAAVMSIISADKAYPAAFRAAFPGEKNSGISSDNLARAIGAFERTLVTPSRWDRFVLGEATALTSQEKEGLAVFVEVGCAVCHQGTYVGADRYRKLGSMVPWPSTADPGRQRITGEESDWMVFKVASLRNVDRTGPYFHDGSVARLDDAVRAMARHQLGRTLETKQVDAILAWFGALTGPLPGY